MSQLFSEGNQSYPIWFSQKGYACITRRENGKDRAFLLHKIVWEAANGPVPPGHEIHHLDHDKSNWRLENLMAMDRKTHQELHRQARSTNIDNKAGVRDLRNLPPSP